MSWPAKGEKHLQAIWNEAKRVKRILKFYENSYLYGVTFISIAVMKIQLPAEVHLSGDKNPINAGYNIQKPEMH